MKLKRAVMIGASASGDGDGAGLAAPRQDCTRCDYSGDLVDQPAMNR